jgi:DNA-binding GntR family transcriptional regulator
MAASFRHFPATRPAELAELRLLIELPALRRLANRGLSDEELALASKLADATMRAARSGDVPGYLRADMIFHLCLLELTGDPAVCDVARLVLAPDRRCVPGAGQYDLLLAREAREHRELVAMCAEGMVSAADHLLRLHLSRRSAGRATPARLAEPQLVGAAGARHG